MRLTIVGASGHGKVIAEVAAKSGYDEIEFLDDDRTKSTCGVWEVAGSSKEIENIQNDIFVAIGNASIRQSIMDAHVGKHFPTLIHPSAVIADDAIIEPGTVIMAGAVINPGSRIGRGCILNTLSSVDHDCVVGEYSHIAVGAHLCGSVRVGRCVWIGAGCTIINNLSISDGNMIGAGAVVTKDIDERGTYVGVPARLIVRDTARGGGGITS